MNRANFWMYLLFLASCTGAVRATLPGELPLETQLNGWPRNRVRISVSDARPAAHRKGDPAALLTQVFQRALSSADASRAPPSELHVTLIEAVAQREGERWHGTASVQVELFDSWGKLLRKAHANGRFSRNGGAADECIARALRAALLETFAQMDQQPIAP